MGLVAACISCGGTKTPIEPGGGGGGGGGITPSGPVDLIGAGDIALCGSPGTIATANQLDLFPMATVFAAGDTVYFHGTPDEYRDCYEPTWGRNKFRTWAVPGNHEYETPGASGFYTYFGSQAGPPGQGYFRRTLGSWTVIGLNSEIDAGPGSPQLGWLRADLQNNPKPCTVAIWHRPLFSSGPNAVNLDARDLWRTLYEFNVDVIINGHDHLYERFAPQNPDGDADSARGIRQFTVGTGGAESYAFNAAKRNSERRVTGFGIVKFTLTDNGYSWEFLPVNPTGNGDSGSGTCH